MCDYVCHETWKKIRWKEETFRGERNRGDICKSREGREADRGIRGWQLREKCNDTHEEAVMKLIIMYINLNILSR